MLTTFGSVNPVYTHPILRSPLGVMVEVFYGAGDSTLFPAILPGQSVSMARGVTSDTTTISLNEKGDELTFNSSNAGTGFDGNLTTAVAL